MRSIPTYKPVDNIAIVRIFVLIIVVVPFLATLLAIRLLWQLAVNWSDLVLLAVMYCATVPGVTIGYHRMLTHRSFRANPVVKAIFLILGSMSVQGPAIDWAATHVKHHALADREGDPHSPLDGFFHAHVGWLFKGNGLADPNIYCRHLVKDRIVVFISYTFWLWVALSLVVPYIIGGWTGLLWGGLVRIFLLQHVIFSVNSICHTFGKREFETNDQSHNQWLVGLLAFGDGWHNNHHAFPRSAFHGLHWWQFDCNGYIILILERLGLVHDVYRVPEALLERRSSSKTSTVTAESKREPGANH
jgi:stearoyl-CoA desaturase (delta-9 desaturase)